MLLSPYPFSFKTLENNKFSDVFKGVRKTLVAQNGLNSVMTSREKDKAPGG